VGETVETDRKGMLTEESIIDTHPSGSIDCNTENSDTPVTLCIYLSQ
jgi:hypothetical protein